MTNVRFKKTPRIYYGWIIVGLSFFTMAFQVFTRYGFAIFQVPLIAEFGWKRGTLSGAFALSLLSYAIAVPFMGSLLEKRGPRAVMPWGPVLAGCAMLFGYFVNSLLHIYILMGLLVGLAIPISGFATHSAIIPRWFLKKRGRAVGMSVVAGAGFGVLFLSPITERLIALFGWRHAYLILGFFILLVLVPANFLLMRNRPEDVGQARDGNPLQERDELPPLSMGKKTDQGVRKVFHSVKNDKKFRLFVLFGLLLGFHANTILSHLHLYLVDTGYNTSTAAIIFGSVGFLRAVSGTAMGWVSDLIGRGRGGALSALIAATGVGVLLLLPLFGGGIFAGIVFVLIYGTGAGGLSVCYSSLAGDLFEGPRFGVIMGFFEISYALGGVVGAPLAGYTFDHTGSYAFPFILTILGTLLSAFVILRLAPSRNPQIPVS